MNTIVGTIDNKQVISYLDKLTNRVFKVIPMSEEKSTTLEKYVDSIVRELFGNSQIVFQDELLAIVGTLKGLDYRSHSKLRSDIFKVIEIISRTKDRVE
jgi:hypothetical protein